MAFVPASVFGLCTTEVSHAEIVPLGTPGMVMALLWLPDHQLMLDARLVEFPERSPWSRVSAWQG